MSSREVVGLVELDVVEQRYAAMAEVLNEDVTVTEVASRAGMSAAPVS